MSKTLTGLSKIVMSLEGKALTQVDQVTPITCGSIIGNSLAKGQSDDPVRAMAIALKIYSAKDKLDLEDADFRLALKAVKDDNILNNMAKAAALDVLNAATSKAK